MGRNALPPSLVALAAKLALGVIWYTCAAFASAGLLRSSPGENYAAAAILIGIPVLWAVGKAIEIKRADEARAWAMLRGAALGLLLASVLPGAMLGGAALSSLMFGDGVIHAGDMGQRAITYAALTPPTAFVLGEVFAFAMLMVFARNPD